MIFSLRKIFGTGAQKLVGQGLDAEAAGNFEDARRYYAEAIEADPGFAPAHYNLGLIQLGEQSHSMAEASFRTALQSREDFPDAWVALAEVLEASGRDEEALAALDKAAALREHFAGALLNASALLQKMERLEEAGKRLRDLPADFPNAHEAHFNLGIALAAQGRFGQAEECYGRALAINPDYAEACNNLGTALQSQGRLDDALLQFRRALSLNPGLAQAQANIAGVLAAQGLRIQAARLLFDALEKQPASAQMRATLADTLFGHTLGTASEKERRILLGLCQDDKVSMLLLAAPIVGLMKADQAFQILLESARRGGDPFASAQAQAFFRDPLYLAALPRMAIADPELEEAFTHLRRTILRRLGADAPIPFDFVCALAGQCFYSQFVYFVQEDEERQEQAVRASAIPDSPESTLAVAALYGSLQTLAVSEQLLGRPLSEWSDAFRPLVQEQLVNRRMERELAARIPALTSISDAVSVAVRAQYEENPYPPWVSAQHGVPETFEALCRKLRPGREVRVHARPVPILIAGCGTGHHPVSTALERPDGDILAVDLSLASLAYASRMAARLGITNIAFGQADILRLGELDRRFAIIESAGVLHHLKDPMEGWRVLAGLMEPDGLMRIALYSERARRGIRAAREVLAPLNLPPTAEGIRACRRAILDLPAGHPAKDVLGSGDFYTLNGCRDLLMHIQEHTFTLPQIRDCLEKLGLRLLRLETDAQTQERFKAMFPDAALTDLQAWDRFEAAYPRTFAGMISCWCEKAKDGDGSISSE